MRRIVEPPDVLRQTENIPLVHPNPLEHPVTV